MKMVNQQKSNQSQKIETLEKHIENLSMALRINQLMLKQVVDQMQPMQSELKLNTTILNDFQYRVLGLQKYLPINNEELSLVIENLKLTDWQQASDKDDRDNKLETKEEVSSKDDVVIITSKVLEGDLDNSIFRSKIKLEETGEDVCNALLGKKIGDSVEVVIKNDKHLINLLGVRAKVNQ